MENNEKIICSAIWFKKVEPRANVRPINTPGGVVLCGHRHGHIISQIVALTGKKMYEMGESVQGFLTNRNRFVDRKEGAEIHVLNGGKLNYSSTDLFSEDIY